MQARFYLPWVGRFGSPDPARDQHFEQTQSWNIYSYVQNKPTMKIDPTGLELRSSEKDSEYFLGQLRKIAPNANVSFKDGKYSATLKDGAKTSKGFELLNKVISSDKVVNIVLGTGRSGSSIPNEGRGSSTFLINPKQGANVWTVDSDKVKGDGSRPMSKPFVKKERETEELLLAHELIHGMHAAEGTQAVLERQRNSIWTSPMPGKFEINRVEEYNTIGIKGYGLPDGITENAIRGELGYSTTRVAEEEAQ